MEWVSNANTIASLVLAIFGLTGYIFTIVMYLKNKATPTQQHTTSQATPSTSQNPPVNYQPFTWMEWIEFLGQGLVDTADFILKFCFQKSDNIDEEDINDMSVIAKLGGCLGICFLGGLIGLFILGLITSFLLTGLGIPNNTNASGVIAFILFSIPLSLVYFYHVGRLVEQKRQEQYQMAQTQQQTQQSI